MLSTLEAKNIKVGDELVAVSTYMTNLILNKTYTISFVSNPMLSGQKFVQLFETNLTYYSYRFKLDIKTIRLRKLEKLNNI